MQGRAIEEMEFVAVDAPKATRKVARERARSMMRQQAAFAVGGTNSAAVLWVGEGEAGAKTITRRKRHARYQSCLVNTNTCNGFVTFFDWDIVFSVCGVHGTDFILCMSISVTASVRVCPFL